MLFLQFSIAVSMISWPVTSKMRVDWVGAEGGFYIRLEGTYHTCGPGASGSGVSVPEEGDRSSPYQYERDGCGALLEYL